MLNRQSLLDKIRALLSKTVDNGCSEPEALAALDKARAMMDAYEVTEADLKLEGETAKILRSEKSDPNGIKSYLGTAVASFCDCKVWRGRDGITFCGLQSDAEFARWLLETLAEFVRAELVRFLMGRIEARGECRFLINGFVIGCTARISERMNELVRQSKQVAASNSRALVVVKTGLIADAMKAAGINLGRARRSRRGYNPDGYAAGRSAGDRASFGRPVGGAGAAPRIGRS